MNLALFDFDGTITTHDTLIEFTKASVGRIRFLSGMAFISPVLVLQKAGLVKAQKAKEIFLSHFFKDNTSEEFNAHCTEFSRNILPALIRPGALAAIKTYKENGDRAVIVSASPINWILPWASKYQIEVIATELDFNGGKFTGRISGKNCNGEEKVRRIKEFITLSDYKNVIAYGDTSGDLPMLELASEKNFKPFRK